MTSPYLTYAEYQAAGGTMEEAEFSRSEALAETYMDAWTLNRLHVPEAVPEGAESRVKAAMRVLVDYLPSIEAEGFRKAEGQEVTSFSNGVTSLGFGSAESGKSAATLAAYRAVVNMLPLELSSVVATYNHAN